MRQNILIFLIIILHVFGLVAQDEKLSGVFAFVYNPIASLPDYDDTHLDQSVGDVFDNLIRTKGVRSILTPRLIISDSESVAAWAHPQERVIGIEKKALAICRSMGPDSLNAIAALLSHELIHYYENHDWHNHFVHQYSELKDSATDTGTGRQLEMEADDMGGILAHMAGYESLTIMPKLLKEIYNAYDLDPSASTSYPDLENRIKMATLSSENLTKMIPLFEIANYMAVTGEVEVAASYYEYIVKTSGFVSRELQNNLGVLYAISAYGKRPNQKSKFIMPFQLDLESRLGTKGMESRSYNQLRDAAIGYFEAARELDKEYAPVIINLASVYLMDGDFLEAEYLLRKLSKFDPNNENIMIVNGLIAAAEGNAVKAAELWKVCASNGSTLAARNLEILNNAEVVISQVSKSLIPRIDNVDLDKLYAQISQDQVIPKMNIDITEDVSFYSVEMDRSDIYIHMDYETDNRFSFFHIIAQSDEQLPVSLGTPVSALHEEFGIPEVIFSTARGSIYNYKSMNMLAIIEEGKVKKWCIYKQNLN